MINNHKHEFNKLEYQFTKKPTVWELAEAFSDCRHIAIRQFYILTKEIFDFKKLVNNDLLSMIFFKAQPRYKYLKRLRQFILFTKTVNSKRNIEQLNIQKAKMYPIIELYDFDIRNNTPMKMNCKCPFHAEEKPSFFIYKNTNTFYCFSCQSGGDNIAFIQKLKNYNFVEAVKMLLKQ